MTKTLAIEPGDTDREFTVVEYDDELLLRSLVYVGTQTECEKYVRDNEEKG